MKSFCRFCGADLPEGSKFCKKCGRPVKDIEIKDDEIKETEIKNGAGSKENAPAADNAAKSDIAENETAENETAENETAENNTVESDIAWQSTARSNDTENNDIEDSAPMHKVQTPVSVKLIIAVIIAGCAAAVSLGFCIKAYREMKAQEPAAKNAIISVEAIKI